MKTTDSHIQELYIFTRQHFVEYYDVQTELVDHLTNDIEKIWESEPKLTFEQARDKSFKKFGVFGFMDVVEKRTRILEKKYWKLVWQVFKQFFRVPQIIITITLFIGLYQVFLTFPNMYLFPILSIILFSTIIIRLMILQSKKRKRFTKTNKKWLLEDSIYRLGNIMLYGNIFLQLGVQIKTISSDKIILFIAFVFTVFIFLVYITAFVLPSKVEKILENQYPEYKLVTNT